MRTRRSLSTALAAALLLLTLGAACGETQAVKVDPSIGLETEGGRNLAEIDFGSSPLGVTAERSFVIRSASTVSLSVTAIEFTADDPTMASAFGTQQQLPVQIASLQGQTVKLTFTPSEVKHYLASLVIRSNDPDRREQRIPVRGEGIAGRLEVMACLPSTAQLPDRCSSTAVAPPDPLEMGTVVAGSHAAARITLLNGGGDVLHVSAVAFVDPAAAAAAGFTLPEEASGGMVIPSREAGVFDVGFDPPVGNVGPAAASVKITSDSLTDPEVTVELKANVVPNSAPEACLYVREILRTDGQTVTLQPGASLPAIEPTDAVILEASEREGCTGDAEDPIEALTLDWSFTGPGRLTRLEPVSGQPLRRKLVPEFVGSYAVTLVATDTLGATSPAATVSFDVTFNQDIATELSWTNSPGVDLDVHLVRYRSENFAVPPNDASAWTKECDGAQPNWGNAGQSFDDPALLLDDTGLNNLVETITLDGAEAARDYYVFAHFFADARPERNSAPSCSDDSGCTGGLRCSAGKCMAPVQAQMTILLDGVNGLGEGQTLNRELGGPGDTWLVGRILWPAPGEEPLFQSMNVVFPDGGMSCTP